MKSMLVNAALRAGYTLGQLADEQPLRDLISRLHPVVTERSLIRVGGRGDGGYLVPDDLTGIAACFSPGVAQSASFEKDMIAREIPCYLADGSVEGAPISNPLIHFERKFLGVVDDERTLTLDTWVDAHVPGDSDLLLQMDIEGGEWPVLLNVSEKTLRRFRIIVLELHGLNRLIDRVGFSIFQPALDRLLRYFHVVHNHPNNYEKTVGRGDIVLPRVLEMSFMRKDRGTPIGYANRFPHPLDVKNRADAPDVVLPRIWYR